MNGMNWNVDTPEGLNNAIAWAEDFLGMLDDVAVWGVPRSGTVLRIEKRKRRVVVILGSDPSTEKVFKAMGWTWEQP